MKKPLLLLLICSLLTIVSKAQDFNYGNFSQDELIMKSYAKDTSAHAVVLNEYGTSNISLDNNDDIRLIYQYHVKIKIFDKLGAEKSNIEIPFYKGSDQSYEEVDNITGVTTYTDDNGMVQTAKLNPSKIFNIKNDTHFSTIKFAMPAVRNGCIIEYKYRVETPYFKDFHSWRFQSDIPKIYSEYEVHIPAFFNFNASMRGYLKLTKNKGDAERSCFTARGSTCDCSHFIYAMSDIPAFIEEAYMTSPNNFLSAIYFELTDYTDLHNGANLKVAKEWKDVDYDLKHSEYFGQQIRKKGLLQDRIAPVIAGKKDSLEKAKAIYAYIQKTMKWNENNDYGSEDGIHKALDNHTGNVADINLSLVAALYAAGISVDAILLSTRGHGLVNKLYPTTSDFNYVIAKVDIGNKSYLLDATDPLLPFGILPLRCLNDQGRVMSLDKPSYWINLTTQQRQNSTYLLDFTLQNDGKITGTITHYSVGYEAYEKRKAIKKFNSVDEYIEDLANKARYKILKSDITNLDSLDVPLDEKYDIEIKEFSSLNHDRLAFNPFVLGRITTNPFKLADRTYPVDWGMPSIARYTLTMHLPDNFSIDSPPKSAGITLPNDGGSFVTNFEADSNGFTFSHLIQFNKSVYTTEEYPYLKELYNKIILSEKGEMIFKKKL
jgi:hypothetical protein